jgi:GTP-binding protein HflX
VGAPRKRSASRLHVDEHLEELARLVDTAGAEVVGTLTQAVDRPHPGTYLGSGKLEELGVRIGALGATLIVFDDELSPAQARNIEQATSTRVMDRAELILDIFATRARSAEARMQVELAQLEYTLPRLTRMWTHLDTYKGGIGMRGPGETQLETDRRLIQHRIKVIKERLVDVDRAREVQRRQRTHQFKVALVGYTNAGKSSILRALAGDGTVFVEDRLFATLDPLTREVDVGEGYTVLLTDTVGFIRKLPHHLVASFRATLAEAREADLLLHVVDVSHPSWEEHRVVVDEVLADLGLQTRPTRLVCNKMDAVPDAERGGLEERVHNLVPGALFVSAHTAAGLEPLREALVEAIRRQRPLVSLRLAAHQGAMLASLHREGEVVEQHADGADLVVTARVDERLAGRLRQAGVAIEPAVSETAMSETAAPVPE